MGVRAMLGGDLTGPPRSYALRRRSEARTRSRNGIRGSGGGAGGFTAFFAALRADCRDCSASWPSRAARCSRCFLQRPPGRRAPPSPAASSRSRACRVPEAHRQDRPESLAGDLPPKRRRPEPAGQGRLLPLQIRHMDCGCAVSMARMLAIGRVFGEVARRNRLNLDGEHGHGGERYSENELLHANLRRLSNRHRPPWRAGAVLNRRTPDGSAAMHPTLERRFVRPALRRYGVRGPHVRFCAAASRCLAIIAARRLRQSG
jgi:hypothetical protein